MIPIAFVTMVESMVMQLPPVDLGVVAVAISAGALAVSVYTFYITHTHTSRREQIKTSMYLWERINENYDPIVEINRSEDKSRFTDDPWKMLRPLFREIDHFAYLVLHDQIKDEKVLGYYRDRLSEYIKAVMECYDLSPDIRHDLLDQYPDFNRLTKKWNINIPDEET